MAAQCQRPKGLRKAEGEIARDRLRVSIFPKVILLLWPSGLQKE